MTIKNKTKHNDEINILEILFILSNNKLKVLVPIVISLFFMSIYIIQLKPIKGTFKTATSISPISKFDEFEYEKYNSYLASTSELNMDKLTFKSNISPFIINELSIDGSNNNLLFKTIEGSYLLELSIEKLKDDVFISNTINQFKLLKNKNYENIENHQIETFKIDPLFYIKKLKRHLIGKLKPLQMIKRYLKNFKFLEKN